MKKCNLIYSDWIHYTNEMPDEYAWKLFKIILAYNNWIDLPEMDLLLKVIWWKIKSQIDENNASRETEVNKRKESGKLWGIAKASNAKQKIAVLEKEPNILASLADTDTDTDINNIDKSILGDISNEPIIEEHKWQQLNKIIEEVKSIYKKTHIVYSNKEERMYASQRFRNWELVKTKRLFIEENWYKTWQEFLFDILSKASELKYSSLPSRVNTLYWAYENFASVMSQWQSANPDKKRCTIDLSTKENRLDILEDLYRKVEVRATKEDFSEKEYEVWAKSYWLKWSIWDIQELSSQYRLYKCRKNEEQLWIEKRFSIVDWNNLIFKKNSEWDEIRYTAYDENSFVNEFIY